MGERLAATVLAFVVAACGAPAGQMHELTLRTPDGQYPLRVRFGDTSRSVVTIQGTERLDHAASNDPAVSGVPGAPDAFVLSWIGGMCDSDALINFWPEEGGFGLQLHTNTKPGLGCPSAGIARALRVELTAPASVDDIRVVPGA
jgi:hypothetical protein